MEVIQRKSEEMEIKVPLINHYKDDDDGEEAMEESLEGRRARVSKNEANGNGPNGHAAFIDELKDHGGFSNGNVDKSQVEEIANEDGAENGHLSNNKNVYFDNNEGPSTQISEPGNNFKFEDFGGGLDVDIQRVISSVINGKTGADFNEEILSDFSPLPQQQEDSTRTNASAQQTRNGTENLQVDIVDEIDEEVIELEFERAVEKMHAHKDYEMYCPNCSNRITKVVLRRRKIAKKVPAQPPKKPLDLFGCLSCFSIFTNAGNKLNPFRIFGKGREPESSPIQQQQQDQQQMSNEFPSTSTTVSNVQQQQQQQQQTSNEFSSTSTTVSNVQQQHNSVVTSSITTSSTQFKGKGFDLFSIFGKRRDEGRNDLNARPSPTSEQDTETFISSLGNSNQVSASNDTALRGKALLGSTANKVAAAVALAGNHYQTSSLQGSALNGRVNIDNKDNLDGLIREEKQHVMPGNEIREEHNITAQQFQGDNASIASDNSNEEYAGYNANGTMRPGKALLGSTANKVAAAVAIAGNRFQSSSSLQESKPNRDLFIDIDRNQEDFISSVKHPVSVGSEIREQVDITSIQQQAGDVQVVIEKESIQRETSQFTVGTTVNTVPGIMTEVQSSRSLDILKAIVYGGLMESIASLSIVSSAAASGTSTLKILALGLAYLISGLMVIGHNLRDLRHDELSGTREAESRYKELLGRRENYILHAVVVVLSYLVFGIVPPLTYAFTFRESDDRDYKLLAVSAVSLLCIIILAISKAYTRGQHKFSVYFKAVVYYVSCAVMVGGIAYAVGDLGEKLMEKWGLWDSSSPVHSILVPEIKSIYPGLASY